MNASSFISKWRHVELTERSAAHSHFLDLCKLVDHPSPVEVDPKGEWFTFEKGVRKQSGKRGWADVWMRDHFAFEYKGRHKDLDAAYVQLLLYRNALENPPLLVACDMGRFVIHTNFTGTVENVHDIGLEELADSANLDKISWVFHAPKKLEPKVTREAITNRVAGQLGKIAQEMRGRGLHPRAVAKFLNRLVFCMFAEDVGLLPTDLFKRLVGASNNDPAKMTQHLKQLFNAMAKGGFFGLDAIRHFNGNLFQDATTILPTPGEMSQIKDAARLDWSQVDPSIFGTLFERAMDPDKRSQLGAHYTNPEDIETLIEPVVMEPLRREWAEVRRDVEKSLEIAPDVAKRGGPAKQGKKPKGSKKPDKIVRDFLQRLQSVTVLDPACGSGNFLYVALQKLKDLEKEVLVYFEIHGFGSLIPLVNPRQMMGLEINPYAYDLAQMTVWIGYLQWQRANGYRTFTKPVLERLDTFRCMDSILDLTDPSQPKEPEWPDAEFIVGNPPFLGDKKMRGDMGDAYVSSLRTLYDTRIPGQSDLCCYWFEKARGHVQHGKTSRVGLLATQGIRGGANREALNRIKESGDIFWALSDKNWILDGANVHVSMVGFDDGKESRKVLDGLEVLNITANLTASANVSQARTLKENVGLGFIGVAQKAPFDINLERARTFLIDPNPDGRPNSDVLRPTFNAIDLTRRPRNIWNVDFGLDRTAEDSALFAMPFQYVEKTILPLRRIHREARQVKYWWLFARPCPEMRKALSGLSRYIGTPRVSKHRVYVWLTPEIICDSALVVFSRSDDYFFGLLTSRVHAVWAFRQGTFLEDRPRYTPSTCFINFPFPEPTENQRAAITDAALDLDALRTRWLNPPEWTRREILEFPGSIDGPWARFVTDPDDRGIGMVRYPVIRPGTTMIAKDLADRTLTKLYNAHPAWLQAAHRRLDEAVFAAYGWEAGISDDEILSRLLSLNLKRAGSDAVVPDNQDDDR